MLIQITSNQEANATLVKQITHTDGRDYLIVPSVAIVEGVMNDILYLEEDMTAELDIWNGRPLMIDHPLGDAGQYISANSPELHAQSPGLSFGASFEDGRLKYDWWIDVAKSEAIGGQAEALLTGLKAGEMFEQSTGLFSDIEEKAGTFNGVPFVGIAHNIRPDHTAILFGEEGACSIEDGCGAPRVNSDEGGQADPPATNNDSEQTKIWGLLRPLTRLLKKFESSDTERLNAEGGDGEPTDGDVEINESEVNVMSREELIEALLGRETGFLTRAMLEAADDETLAELWAQFGEMAEEPEEPAVAADQEGDAVDQPEHPANNDFELPSELVQMTTMIGEFGGRVAPIEKRRG